MLRHTGVTAIILVLLAICVPSRLSGQDPVDSDSIPIERCDLLPVVKIRIDGADMRFLLDTGATTMLNLKSFRSEEHTSELQSLTNLVCRLLLEKKKNKKKTN